jgi:NADH-quinone oxidoreductase subunit K
MITATHYLVLSAVLFSIGCVGVMVRKNLITLLLSIELMLNAVNLNFVAFSHQWGNLLGQVFAIFVMTVAAGEAAVGLGIIVAGYRMRLTVEADTVRDLEG